MARVGSGRIFRAVTLALILGVFAWALLPPKSTPESSTAAPGPGARQRKTGVKYVLRLCPGVQYMPGSVPMGIGEPLKGITRVVADFEARFPDTQVEIVSVPINREYLVTQLSSGLAPDILNVNVEDVWVDVQKNWYVALDQFLDAPNEFIREKGDPAAPGYDHWWDMFQYQAISRGKAGPDGKMYCISYDMVETAVYYNKDVFAQLGLSVPNTWEEFIALCKKIKGTPVKISGEREPRTVTPMVTTVEVFVDWCNDLMFDQLYKSIRPGIDLLKDPNRASYQEGYLDDVEIDFLFRRGFFTQKDPRYRELFRIMRDFRGYCGRNIAYNQDIIREFVSRRGAMVWLPCSLSYRLDADKKLGFSWGTFYLPQFTKQTSRFASNVPMCVIGGSSVQFEVSNSAVSDTPEDMPFSERVAKSERLKRTIQLLEFLCVPEQYAKIVNEYPGYVPNIKGVPTLPLLKPFEEILERPYTTTKWAFTFDLKFYEIFRRLLDLYLNNGLTLDQFLEWQVANIKSAVDNLELRKKVPMQEMQKAWDAEAPLRAGMEGLPGGS